MGRNSVSLRTFAEGEELPSRGHDFAFRPCEPDTRDCTQIPTVVPPHTLLHWLQLGRMLSTALCAPHKALSNNLSTCWSTSWRPPRLGTSSVCMRGLSGTRGLYSGSREAGALCSHEPGFAGLTQGFDCFHNARDILSRRETRDMVKNQLRRQDLQWSNFGGYVRDR